MLWLSGNPGSGKSVLLSYVSKQLGITRQTKDGKTIVVVYFFCDSKISEQNTATAILRSLLYQILYQLPSLYKKIPYDYLHNKSSSWGFGNLWRVFQEVITKNWEAEIFCVVDALDECEETSRTQLLENLPHLFKNIYDSTGDAAFRILISSRPHIPIAAVLSGPQIVQEVYLGNHNDNDIRQFVGHEAHRLAQMKSLPQELEHHIRNVLVASSGGMFLWASLTLSRLIRSSETSTASIRAQLKELPKDIPGVYAKILAEIDLISRDKAKRVLRWILFAKRPLTMEELRIVLAIWPDHSYISELRNRVENNLNYFLSTLFGPLLKIENGIVGFVHESAQDFLTDLALMRKYDTQESSVSVFYSSPTDSNICLAIDCLTYLSSEEFGTRPSQDILAYYGRLTDYEFLEYAAMNWSEHIRSVVDETYSESLLRIFSHLFLSEAKINSAYRIYYEKSGKFDTYERKPPFKPTPPLQICASFGFPVLVRLLLRNGVDVNALGGIHQNSLLAAIWSKNVAVLREILASPALDITLDETTLCDMISIWPGDAETLELILRKKHQVTTRMMIASMSEGNTTEPLKLLLKKGGQINEQLMMAAAGANLSEDYLNLLITNGGLLTENVLIASAQKRYHTNLAFLLEKGCRATNGVMLESLRGDINRETLELMVNSNEEITITEEILKTAAENSRENDGLAFLIERAGVPVTEQLLMVAASNIHGAHCLDLLLKKNRKAPITRAVFEQAMRNIHVRECLMLLVGRGGQITEAVMISASENLNNPKELLQILLSRGGEITHKVMLAAVCNQHGLEALEFLLGRGGPVTEDMMERALSARHVVLTLQLLLDCGGQVTETIMLKAVEYRFAGGKPTVELLLNYGGQPTRTVMVGAVAAADAQTIELLINRGGHIDENVILAAVSNRHCVEIMEMLVKRGGIITRELMLAAAKGSVELLKFLLSCDNDADLSEEMLVAAAGNPNGSKALELLLTSDHIPITEPMMVKAALSERATENLALLLRKGGLITDDVLIAAAGNPRIGALELLLSFDGTVDIPDKAIMTAAGNSVGKEMLELMITNGHSVIVTHENLLSAAGNNDGGEVLKFLLKLDTTVAITEQIVVRAVESGRFKDAIAKVELLLSSGVRVTQAVIIATISRNFGSNEVLETLICHDPEVEVTDEIILAAVANSGSAEALEYLLKIYGTFSISETILLRAARKESGDTYLRSLLGVGGQVTEAVAVAAAGNVKDIRALQYLFSEEPTMLVTEKMLLAAARVSATLGRKAMDMLLSHVTLPIDYTTRLAGEGGSAAALNFLLGKCSMASITEEIMIHAAHSLQWSTVFDTLLSIKGDLPITDAVLAAGAENCQKVLNFLFNRVKSIKEVTITERMILGAAFSWDGKGSLEYLRKANNTVEYTDDILTGAIWNPRGKENLEFLLQNGGNVTETVMIAAALSTHGKESLEVLLNYGGQVTESVMIAAAWNPGLHARATAPLEFLVSKGGIVNKTVMLAMAMNPGEKVHLELQSSKGLKEIDALLSGRQQPTERECVSFLLRNLNKSTRETLLQVAKEFRWPQEEAIARNLGYFYGRKIAASVLKQTAEQGIDDLIGGQGFVY